jgi:hypothetical protein
MGFNSAFKGINIFHYFPMIMTRDCDYPLPLMKLKKLRKKIKYYNYLIQLIKIEAHTEYFWA